ncbi:hypothetical protein Tco_0562039 [Tanacetum coccineum]
MGAFAEHPHSDSNEVLLVSRKYRYTNEEAQSQIDLFTAFALTLKRWVGGKKKLIHEAYVMKEGTWYKRKGTDMGDGVREISERSGGR